MPLVPISLALGFTLILAAAAAVGLIVLALIGLGSPDLPHGKLDVTNLLEVVKISLAVVAGVGGVVALVVAYRKQRLAEAGEAREHTKLYAERFTTAANQLGSDAPAVRLAGVHALAALADDWPGGRQMCIDVLCAYLRMPPEPEPDAEHDPSAHGTWRAMREVRATILRLIATHLRGFAATPWHGHDFDFTGVVFDNGADFTGAVFSGGEVRFDRAVFSGGEVWFAGAEFTGCQVWFDRAVFSGGEVWFGDAVFSGGQVLFTGAVFSGGEVRFDRAVFSGGEVWFAGAEFTGGEIWFRGAELSGGEVWFDRAVFSAGKVSFYEAVFSGGKVWFTGAKFSGGEVLFTGARFSGGEVSFYEAVFSGGQVDFHEAADWSKPPIDLPAQAPGLDLPPRPVSHAVTQSTEEDTEQTETGDGTGRPEP